MVWSSSSLHFLSVGNRVESYSSCTQNNECSRSCVSQVHSHFWVPCHQITKKCWSVTPNVALQFFCDLPFTGNFVAGSSTNHSCSWTIAAASGSGVSLLAMTVSLFSVVKGGVALATATVGCSKDVLVLDGASNVGHVAVGCVEASIVVKSPSADPSNAPPPVGTVAAVGVSTALTDRMFNLQGRIIVPPRSYAAITNVVVLLVVKFFITSTWVTMP